MELFKLLGTIAINNSDANKALKETSSAAKGMADDVADASSSASGSSSKWGNAFKKIGSGAVSVGKTVATGLAAGATALGALTAKALSSAGELEQNMGGSEAVFGEYAASIQDTAKTAFSNMGLSTSNYLATANKMGALFQGAGFDIEESMTLSQNAMQRAADVASIMGIDTEAAMEAIAGAAKGNFTMMDNLGVAMNDTAIEAYAMSKGIEKSTKDMTQQEKIGLAMEMFLEKTAYATGNYAKENETLAGSLGTAKAALSNFISGSGTVEDVVSSFTNAANVIVKNIDELFPKLMTGITELVNQLVPLVPQLLEKLLPGLISGATGLINGLVAAMPQIVSALMAAVPALISGITQIINALIAALPGIIQALVSALPALIPALVDGLVSMIVTLCTMIPQIIQPLIDNLPAIIISIVNALMANLPALIQGAVQLVVGLVAALPQIILALVDAMPTVIMSLVRGLISAAPALIQGMKDIWNSVTSAVSTVFTGCKDKVVEIAGNIKEKATEKFGELKEKAAEKWESMKAQASEKWESMKSQASEKWESMKSKIVEKAQSIKSKASEIWGNLKSNASDTWDSIKSKASEKWDAIKEKMTKPIEKAKETISGIVDKIKGFFSGMKIEFPKIKMPHFSISPSGWKIGDLLKGSIPKLGIEWYAKAMNNPMVMTKPTIFGYNAETGQLQGGGETGSEVVSGTNTLMNMIGGVVEAKTNSLTEKLIAIMTAVLDAIVSGNNEMLQALLAGHVIKLNDREVARTVRTYA